MLTFGGYTGEEIIVFEEDHLTVKGGSGSGSLLPVSPNCYLSVPIATLSLGHCKEKQWK